MMDRQGMDGPISVWNRWVSYGSGAASQPRICPQRRARPVTFETDECQIHSARELSARIRHLPMRVAFGMGTWLGAGSNEGWFHLCLLATVYKKVVNNVLVGSDFLNHLYGGRGAKNR